MQRPRGDSWQDEESPLGRSPKRPEISTAQILMGIIAIALVSLIAYLWSSSGSKSEGIEAAIMAPENGARLAAGPVTIRVRANDSAPSTRGNLGTWEVAYSKASAAEQWQVIASGQGGLTPLQPDAGLFFVNVTESGAYRLRVIYRDSEGASAEHTVEFTIVN
jgi:hypothetical protein